MILPFGVRFNLVISVLFLTCYACQGAISPRRTLYADESIPALSRRMSEFINSLNTTWKVSNESTVTPVTHFFPSFIFSR